MTVMVTGASGLIGRALVPILVRNDEVRACVRRPEAAEALRAAGAKVAVGRFDDADALAEILKRVFTVIHLVGGPSQADDDAVLAANHGSVLTALAAAREAGVSRFVLLSATGASIDSPNRYLRAKGLAEEAVANSGMEHAIVRSTHAYGAGGSWLAATVEGATASPPFVIGDGRQSVAPVFADDVAAVLAAADDQRGTPGGDLGDRRSRTSWRWPISSGPSQLREPIHPFRSRPPMPSRGCEALGVHISSTAAELFAMPSRADAPDAAEAFGVTRTTLVDGLRATAQQTAGVER